MKTYLVTGCAGFIGSNLVDYLLKQNNRIIGLDNLSTGKKFFLKDALKNKNFKFYKIDLLKNHIDKYFKNVDRVYHFAANADVRFGLKHRKKDINQNIIVTYRILETIKKSENHFKKKYDVIILVEPTSPLRKVSDLINAFRKFFKYNFDNLWTISEINLDFHPDKQLKIKSKKLIYYNSNGKEIKRRQDLETTYKRNGVCYIINRNVFFQTNKLLNNNTGYLILKEKHISIDTIEDLMNVRKIFKNQKKKK